MDDHLRNQLVGRLDECTVLSTCPLPTQPSDASFDLSSLKHRRPAKDAGSTPPNSRFRAGGRTCGCRPRPRPLHGPVPTITRCCRGRPGCSERHPIRADHPDHHPHPPRPPCPRRDHPRPVGDQPHLRRERVRPLLRAGVRGSARPSLPVRGVARPGHGNGRGDAGPGRTAARHRLSPLQVPRRHDGGDEPLPRPRLADHSRVR